MISDSALSALPLTTDSNKDNASISRAARDNNTSTMLVNALMLALTALPGTLRMDNASPARLPILIQLEEFAAQLDKSLTVESVLMPTSSKNPTNLQLAQPALSPIPPLTTASSAPKTSLQIILSPSAVPANDLSHHHINYSIILLSLSLPFRNYYL